MWLKNASKKIQRAIHEEFHVSPEVAMSLKDEILRKCETLYFNYLQYEIRFF
jgi:hypothetical protein